MKGYSAAQKGFISTSFLIVMCAMIALIAAKSNYIYKANQVYRNLQEFEDRFAREAEVISYFKCMLLRNDEIGDFSVNGTYVKVYDRTNGYRLYYDDLMADVSVMGRMIVAFEISSG